jgi:regulation of enolase protein 1 (concanavalin A-like superfamily)
LVVIAAFTGKTFDMQAVQDAVTTWLPMAANLLTMSLGALAAKGRAGLEVEFSEFYVGPPSGRDLHDLT